MIAYSSFDFDASQSPKDWAFPSTLQNVALFPFVTPWMLVAPMWFFTSAFFVVLPRVLRWIRAKLQGQEIESLRLKSAVWTIHSRRYDLTSWAENHPGGAWALELGRNRDCTCLFETYHVFSDMKKLEKILARYELPESKAQNITVLPSDNSTGLVFRDPFHEDVKQMAKDYFKENEISHKMKPWVLCSVILVIIAEAICAVGLLYGYRIAVVLMPIFGWLLTGNVAHEASHFALSSRPIVNSIFSFTSAPMFYNSTAWYIQHIVQHHVYTNDEHDVDLYHFLPICRTSRFSRYVSIFRLQWLLIWLALPTSVAHLSFVVPLDLLTRQVDAITGTRRYEQCDNLDDFIAGSRKYILLEFILSFGFGSLVIMVHGWTGICWLSVSYSIASACFIVFTQGAHLQEQCMVSKDADDLSWTKRQVLTSVNFKADSLFWSFASGGLNMQALHHILPTISSCHLRDMFPRFREICKKHDVAVKEADGLSDFFGGFLSWVAELAKEDASEVDVCKEKTN